MKPNYLLSRLPCKILVTRNFGIPVSGDNIVLSIAFYTWFCPARKAPRDDRLRRLSNNIKLALLGVIVCLSPKFVGGQGTISVRWTNLIIGTSFASYPDLVHCSSGRRPALMKWVSPADKVVLVHCYAGQTFHFLARFFVLSSLVLFFEFAVFWQQRQMAWVLGFRWTRGKVRLGRA